MHNDMPTKDDRVHLRIEETVKDEAEAVALLRGLKLSSLVHNLLVEAINKERSERPALFVDALSKIREPERKARVQITTPANVADAGKSKPAHTLARQRKVSRKR